VSIFRFSSLTTGAALLLQSCAPSQDAPAPASTLDLSRYVAVGDSYTAGVSNGGLTRTSQQYSFPNLLAQSFERVSATGTFTQPLLDAGAGTSYLTLVSYNGTDLPVLRRVPGTGVRSTYLNTPSCGPADTVSLLTRSATAGTLPQNLGIPSLRLGQINTAGLGNETNAAPNANFNPYFERLLPAADNTSYLQAVTSVASSATFFTFFLGLDDFLPYLRSGGECPALLPTTATLNSNAKRILDVLTANNRRGIIVRLPNLRSLPLLSLGQGLQLERRLQRATGTPDSLYIRSSTNGQSRHITDEDFVLATAISRIGRPMVVGGVTVPYGRSPLAPLVGADVVESQEYLLANNARLGGYNNNLETLAKNTYRLPSIDASNSQYSVRLEEDLFSQVNNQIAINGVPYTTEPVRGNFFSLDYYSLTPRGNALLANAILKAINRAYRSSIPYVNVNDLPTTTD
jgi:hypothetical protein